MAPKTYSSSLPPLPDADFDTSSPTHASASQAELESSCPFCHISRTYPPYNPLTPPPPTSPSVSSSATSPQPSTFLLLSTPLLTAFMDILPLSEGHILLCPRRHAPKLTDSTAAEARELGYYLRILSEALVRTTGVADWNVVQNNGAAAAQVVPHMHFHVIPRPDLGSKRRERFTNTMFGRGQREELDEEEGESMAAKIRGAVAEILREEQEGKAKL
ncbi:hypothetical protein DL546_005562 [Coniochaeta pulveracea]|uniref:HIT domain-containing protein n=1 Tax=Coniochaeta pulveracea TaxID=177199 RepID=A0A420YLK7_9PEZI|nr:hypothetical protein DL546_005562 [Coniochaeta pulveracea]